MTKKNIKVKKKKIKSKIKKKVVKNKKLKRYSQKIVKRHKKKKVTMEDIYKLINKAQLGSKSITFTVINLDADTVENIIKDSIAKYHKVSMKTQTIFTLYPEEKERAFEILEIEQLDDEIVEEGQIFP